MASTTPTPTNPPPYSYLRFIKSPSEMGMSDAGNLPTIEKDINGLIAYVELLVDGPSKASKAQNLLVKKIVLQLLQKSSNLIFRIILLKDARSG